MSKQSQNVYGSHIHQNSKPNMSDAKKIAKVILERYDRQKKNNLSQQDIHPLLNDVYKQVGMSYKNDNIQEGQFFNSIDHDKDGKISLEDIEQMCIQNLCQYQENTYNLAKNSYISKVTYFQQDIQQIEGGDMYYIPHHSIFLDKNKNMVQSDQQQQIYSRYNYNINNKTQSQQVDNNYQGQQNQDQDQYNYGYQLKQTGSILNHAKLAYSRDNTPIKSRSKKSTKQKSFVGAKYLIKQQLVDMINKNLGMGVKNLPQQEVQNGKEKQQEQQDHLDEQNYFRNSQTGLRLSNKNLNLSNSFVNSRFNSKNLYKETQNLSDIESSKIQQLQQRYSLKKIETKKSQKFQTLLLEYEQKGEKFIDHDFPPNERSLSQTGEWYDGSPIPYTDWISATDFFKGDQKLFANGILPGDICQDDMGDCYLQCTLAAMAEWPQRIQKLFINQVENQVGIYGIWVVWSGILQEVIVDDYFWYDNKNRKLVTMTTQDKEIWPQLLEKVWAKLNGDYCSIDGGYARDPLHDFTGAPVIHFKINQENDWKMWKDILWNQLLNGEKAQYIMTASTCIGQGNVFNIDGIILGHAYTIIGAYEIQTYRGEVVQLLKFRNPYGKGNNLEWNGDFSDYDYKSWENIPESEQRRIDHVKQNDGVFFMKFEQLRNYFENVQICYYLDSNEYKGVRVDHDGKIGICKANFEVNIQKPGFYSFQVNQVAKPFVETQNMVKNKYDCKYYYNQASVKVCDEQGDMVSACAGRQRNLSSYKNSLEYQQIVVPGKYYVETTLNFDKNAINSEVDYFGFGVYGEQDGFSIKKLDVLPVQIQDSLDSIQEIEKLPHLVC